MYKYTYTHIFLLGFLTANVYTFRYLYIVFNVCNVNYMMYISSDINILHSNYAKAMRKIPLSLDKKLVLRVIQGKIL